jgi:hypothetical protein
MKKLLAVAALATVIAAPAFAQDRAPQRQQTTYQRNNNANPDFQLGGDRWKTVHRKHPAARHVTQK